MMIGTTDKETLKPMNQQKVYPHPNPVSDEDLGITLRDYLAAKAMQEILPMYERKAGGNFNDRSLNWESMTGNPDAIAELSYQMADAMLKYRKS